MKEIHFHVDDSCTKGYYVAFDFAITKAMIYYGVICIHTTSMAHLSFDLLDQGYRIFVHKNHKCIEFKPGMENPMNKDIRRANNILKMFIAGYFDEMFN